MNELGTSHDTRLSVLGFDPSAQGAGGGDAPRNEASIKDFLNILRRRKAIALQTFVVVLAASAVITFMTRPRYRSTTKILVEGKAAAVAINNTTDPLSNLFLPAAGHEVNTQVEVLRSPILFKKVCRQINVSEKDVTMDVRQVGQTDVIEVGVTSPLRTLAQEFAKAVPRIYLQDMKVSRLREVTSALQFAQRRLKERSERLAQSERALEDFKSRSNIVDKDVQREQDINALGAARASLRQAEADAASSTARYNAMRSARSSLPTSVENPTTVTNPQLEQLNQQLANLREERSKKLFLFQPDQPEIRQIDEQITALERRIAGTPKTVTTTSRTTNPLIVNYDQAIAEAKAAADSAQANRREASSKVAALSASLRRYNPIELGQVQLDRDIASDRNVVETLSKSVEDLSLRLKSIEAKEDPISILEDASQARQVAPLVMRNMVIALLLALILASIAAILQESLDDHLNDEDETRSLFNTPILGHVPLLPSGQSRLVSLRQSDAALLERMRVIRANVQFTLVNRPNRTLLVTSTIPEEGKSSLAANLAISIALDANRVILVDADLHRPKVDKLFGIAQQPGLTNVLVGQATLEEALQQTDIPGLRVLPSGVLPPNAAELLNSNAMDKLLEELMDATDLVIFDSPPCLATADAQVLAAKVDGVIYVMQLGQIRKSSVQRSLELLYQAHANVLGVVFNKMQTNGTSTYYDYEYYGYTEGKDIDDKAIDQVNQSLMTQISSADSATGKNGSGTDGNA